MFLVFVQDLHEQVVLPLGLLQLPEKQKTGVSNAQTLLFLQNPPQPRSNLAGEFAAAPAGRGRHGAEPVDLLLLLLPHAALHVAGDVQVWQLLQEQREELVLIHLHWEEEHGKEDINGRSQTGMWRIPILKTFKNE